ncbi:hypothetical protein EPN87_04625 [archaeon]|nr:MAG: hypothetical protein EPN87_04625 [archaeon]
MPLFRICNNRTAYRKQSLLYQRNRLAVVINEWRCLEKSGSPDWDKIIDNLAAEIRMRHYSRKTLKTYALWGCQFQKFLRNKPPHKLSSADVKEYLTYLAVKCHVSASTQN